MRGLACLRSFGLMELPGRQVMRTVVRPPVDPRPLAVNAAGLVGVLLIHTLLLLPFVLNLSAPPQRRPNTTGAGATDFLSAAEPDMTVVFIDEPTENAAPREAPPLASWGMTPPDLQLVVVSPDPSPPPSTAKTEDAAQDDVTEAAEAVEHAKLYGRYVGQVQSRIERAWMRPRTEIGAPRFFCYVRVQQDRRGELIGITLDHCNGTERWQQSLLSAIRTASPLPAPPDASVYADVLWLTFSSPPFEEGDSAQGFEPETRTRDGSERTATESFQRFASGTQRDAESIIHLTIIGSPLGQPAAAPPIKPQPADPSPE
jgi:hypothetical protein